MTRVYYIKLCWNHKLLYDGYIARKDNFKIFGCTDNSIILGSMETMFEYTSGRLIRYQITEEPFLSMNRYTGTEQYLSIDGNLVKLCIKEDMHRNEQYVINRSMRILKYFPKSIQDVFRQNYLEED